MACDTEVTVEEIGNIIINVSEVDGSNLASLHTPVNYTAAGVFLDQHLAGIDTELGLTYGEGDAPLFDSVTYDVTHVMGAHVPGKTFWNTEKRCLSVMSDIDGTTHDLARELLVNATNKSGSLIPNGAAVYIDGAFGGEPTIELADASGADESRVIGIVTNDTGIANDGEGDVVVFGEAGVDTSAYTAGAALYTSTTPGVLSETRAPAPDHPNLAAYALNSLIDGTILVSPQIGTQFSELHDVLLTSLDDGDVLRWNNTAQVWENATDITLDAISVDTIDSKSGTVVTVDDPMTVTGIMTVNSLLSLNDDLYMTSGADINFRNAADDAWRVILDRDPSDVTYINGAQVVFSTDQEVAGTVALTLDESQNATFAGVVNTDTIGSTSGAGIAVTDDVDIDGNVTVGTGSVYNGINTDGNAVELISASRFGFSSVYRSIQFGDGAYSFSFGVDLSAIGGGQFAGAGKDIVTKQGAQFLQPNAGGTDFVYALRLSGGGAGTPTVDVTDTGVTVSGELLTDTIDSTSGAGIAVSDDIDIASNQLQSSTQFVEMQDHYEDINVNLSTLGNLGPGEPDKGVLGSTTIQVALWDSSAVEEVSAVVELVHAYTEGGDIDPHVHWFATDTGTGDVRWGMEYAFVGADGVVSTSTTIYATEATTGTAWQRIDTGFPTISGTGLAIGTQLHFRFFRDASNAGDTYGSDAATGTFGFHVPVNSIGSDNITSKT